MNSELLIVATQLDQAMSYLDIFGSCDKGDAAQSTQVRRAYRKLARQLHPDVYSNPDDKQVAQAGFQKLQEYLEAAEAAIREGRYGKRPVTIIHTKKTTYELDGVFCTGEIAELYQAREPSQRVIIKLAKNPRDNDLLQAETSALRRLQANDGEEAFKPFFPALLDSFTYNDSKSRSRRANVLERLDGWYSLQEVRQAYPLGVSALDMIWIWRRLLWTLGYVHERGLVHGAVLPNHIMIHPTHHGVKLVDWCYSTFADSPHSTVRIKAISSSYKRLYPPEVLAKEPCLPGTDIYMAVASMTYLLGGENLNDLARTPKAIRAFFKGCSQSSLKQRPQEAWQLLAEFDELLERMGGQYFPRRFRKFAMPN